MANKSSKVRIIGGTHKRRFIEFADVSGLRPTPDRLRETIFNWLSPYMHNARVLDMCAGSGVMGLESISRGAKLTTLIEPNKKQYAMLKKAIDSLHMQDEVVVINQKAELALPKMLEGNTKPYDIIFIDPPYSLVLWEKLLTGIFKYKLCHENTLIYLEADKPHSDIGIDVILQAHLDLIKEKKSGQVFASLYEIKHTDSQ